MPFCFGEQENQSDEDYAVEADVEPPEAALAQMFGHRTGDDGSNLGMLEVRMRRELYTNHQ